MSSINYQFGDVDAHGATIRAQAASLEATHQAILASVRDAADFWGGQGSAATHQAILASVRDAADFWGGQGSAACEQFITDLGRNFQMIYEQANAHGQKVQAAGNNMADTDRSVGSAWA
ncbi:WXG100 family type VII secretion target [Mycobacterium haemophilum]|uniref:WXG100 family type VII secretion target n=1 Tax=Mycobacterium haemophilum TaxID=29311 RepID=UPI0021F3BAE8|nr:WXG100 family type VII secretion target [Mycobacterium haemophilum]MCV7340035.1 WXG100 family type VII secretion target [Mycobacterium haemophilum DSM 44634]